LIVVEGHGRSAILVKWLPSSGCSHLVVISLFYIQQLAVFSSLHSCLKLGLYCFSYLPTGISYVVWNQSM